ncbi:hypothetical protein HTIA_0448 [Halorhabdus tiamatea SARL4B]|uniref:Uncharacterized protein n=1 Tax=Halorhabdus tiamatea SARL4B TaxID=1033806 RepID=S6CSD7_9EURY|nr:hypothetical protein HTIA_0448 [Halorhabdus tiamatea SARL4B]
MIGQALGERSRFDQQHWFVGSLGNGAALARELITKDPDGHRRPLPRCIRVCSESRWVKARPQWLWLLVRWEIDSPGSNPLVLRSSLRSSLRTRREFAE